MSLRAVLVYGPGVKGNMAQLMRFAVNILASTRSSLRCMTASMAVRRLLNLS
jgi:hypothetical protein